VGTCEASPAVDPFCVDVSSMKTWRWIVLPLRPATTLTRPPVVPVGVNVPVADGPV
jgi:hypothetical protein